VIWLLAHSGVARITAYATHLFLAWVLEPRHFGTVALAFALNAFVVRFQENGLDRILVATQEHFDARFRSAQVMAIVSGVICAIILTGVSWPAAHLYGEEQLPGLVGLLALAAVIRSWQVVPRAKLLIDMRFNVLALTQGAARGLIPFMAIPLAIAGWGAYSFVVPQLLIVSSITVTYILVTGRLAGSPPELGVVRILVRQVGMTFGASLFATGSRNMDYLVLGLFKSTGLLGIYFLAYSISVQVISLLGSAITGAALPFLKRVTTPSERRAMGVRILRITSLVLVVSAALLFTGIPIIAELALPIQWSESCLLVQILCVGVAGCSPSMIAEPILNSEGKFGMLAICQGAQALVVTVAAVTFGAQSMSLFAGAIAGSMVINGVLSMFFLYGWSKNVAFLWIMTAGAPLFAFFIGIALYWLSMWYFDRWESLISGAMLLGSLLGWTVLWGSRWNNDAVAFFRHLLARNMSSRTSNDETLGIS